jgi:hypothetical protein
MGLPKFWFRHPPKVAVTCPNFLKIFGSLVPQAMKNFYIIMCSPDDFGT